MTEQRRIEAHRTAIASFAFNVDAAAGYPASARVAKLMDYTTDLYAGRDWQEFADEALAARTATLDALRVIYQDARTREDQAEADRLAVAEAQHRMAEAFGRHQAEGSV